MNFLPFYFAVPTTITQSAKPTAASHRDLLKEITGVQGINVNDHINW